MGNSDYVSFLKEIARFIPNNRIYTDDLRRLAWGTDAGFYRLVPKIVVRSDNEQEYLKYFYCQENIIFP